MPRVPLFILTTALAASIGCQTASPPETNPEDLINLVSAPKAAPSGEPNLFVSSGGQVYLSWVERLDSGHRLCYSVWDDDRWGEAQTIARGENWFVNWADFPSLAVTDTFAVAHWLQKSATGTYDYDIRVALSRVALSRGGLSRVALSYQQDQWGDSFVLHQDGQAAEHGFVTLLPLSAEQILSVWLDGRHTKQEGGAMNLFANIITPVGTTAPGQCLDERVCDCCQTDAALTEQGVVVVYRDRTEDEIRDIGVLRRTAAGWTEPNIVHHDGWQIAGCPVNGPAISAWGKNIAVAWFTAAQETPRVQIVFSSDGGNTFGNPVRIDEQQPLGRVDIELIDATTAVVSWMESTEEGALIRLAAATARGTRSTPVTVAATQASRSSGFPVMAQAEGQIYLAWTQVDTSTPGASTPGASTPGHSTTGIRTARVPVAHFQKNTDR